MAFMMSNKNTVLLIFLFVEVFLLPFFWLWLYGGGFSAWYERHPTKHAPDVVDSAASTSILQASAESTSQSDPTPTQRG